MQTKNSDLKFQKLSKSDEIPYELLLLADPSKEIIYEYLKRSEVFIAIQNKTVVGVIAILPLEKGAVEIKNIAVNPEFQGKGIGTYLIENAIRIATLDQQEKILIGTANSSIGQLYLYQKLGFEITEIKKDFFIKNYDTPIYENGIQAKHMLLLTREL